MKRLLPLLSLFCFSCGHQTADEQIGTDTTINVTRIDPTDWYVGLKDPTLQLMVYGQDIADADVTLGRYKGARIDSVVRPDSKNYLFVYLNLKGAKAGTLHLNFRVDDRLRTVNYELKDREKAGEERIGFSNADVLYMLMPDRFAQGQPPVPGDSVVGSKIDRTAPSLRHGGNLEGVRQHLDYFVNLGVTALWFTPVLENLSPDNGDQSTYHGYATTDYYRVDPRFGSNADYRRLIDEAHEKGLKVVMDMIFNHCGFDHPWVKDMPTRDWLNRPEWLSTVPDGSAVGQYLQTSYKLTPVLDPYASKVDYEETVDGWFVPSMPDLNQKNPHVMRYLIQNSIWWIETVGIDGIRMDTYPYADAEGMAQWMATLEQEYPNFNTVGETWVTEPAYTAAWQKDNTLLSQCPAAPSRVNSHLKTVMDFSFYDKINQAAHEETDAWWEGYNRIYNSLVYDYLYVNPDNVMAFIENHDTDRFLKNGRDIAPLRQALALLLTMRRTPQLYYGTEVLMNGTKEVTDGYVRKDFPGGFPGDERNLFDPSQRTEDEAECYDMHRRLLHWRRGNEIITKGTQTQFCPKDGIYVLARRYKGCTVMTIVNGTDKEAEVQLSRYAELLPNGTITAHDVLSDKNIALTPTGTISIEARGTYVLEY